MEACAATSIPNRSPVMIDSISINIDAAELSKSEKCEHFTMRGFVSEKRASDGSYSWPLSVNYHDASFNDVYSKRPMDVPKFKRWQCQSCLDEVDPERAVENAVSTTVNCSRHLKTNGYRIHRSLENVVSYLSKKSEQHLKLGRAKCKGKESKSKFKRRPLADSGLGKNKLHRAASNFTSKKHLCNEFGNQCVALTNVDKHQEQQKSALTIPINYGTLNGAKHCGKLASDMMLAQNHPNNDGLGGIGRRKTRKVRLLDDLFDKDEYGDQPVVTRDSNANKTTRLNYSALRQKRNKKCHEQDSRHSQMHIADGKVEMRHAENIKSISADAEMHMAPTDGSSGAVTKQAEIMGLKNNQGVDVHFDNYNGGRKRNTDLCRKQEFMLTCQPFDGRAVDPLQNSTTPSLPFKGKSCDTLYKGVNAKSSVNKSKGKNGNSAPKNSPTGKAQVPHHYHSIQENHTSRSHYNLSDGCLDTRKGTSSYVPHIESRNLQNGFNMQYIEESRREGKSLDDINMWLQTKNNSGLNHKRAKQGPGAGNKKQKHIPRTEGVTVVHQTEFLFGPRHKGVGVSHDCPVNSKSTTLEVGTSDDIPMEIVELMAKNQYERRLHEVGDNYHLHHSTSNVIRDVMCSNGALSNMVSATVQGQNSNSLSDLPKGQVISGKGTCISNKRPNGNMMQHSSSSSYYPIQSSQQDSLTGFHSPSLSFSKPDLFRNCKFDMNSSPPQPRVSPRSKALCEEWQPASRQSDKISHAWPMVPPSNPDHMLNTRQGIGMHPFDGRKVPTCSSYVVEGSGRYNSNLAGFGHTANRFGPESSNSLRLNRVNGGTQMTVSPDPYPNESLTAMHLLSLMDDGRQSSSSTLHNVEANSNKQIFDRSFSNDHLAKELSKNNLAVGKSNHRFKPPSPYAYQSKASDSDATYKCLPPVPKFCSVVTSLPEDVGSKNSTLSHHQVQERTYLSRNAGVSLLGDKKSSFKSQNPRLAYNSSAIGHELIPAHELSQHISDRMWYGSGSSHLYMHGNSTGYYNCMPAQPFHTPKRQTEPGPCYVNRNPMDFTTPGPGNEYMIGTEELKFRSRIHNPCIAGPFATSAIQHNRFKTYTPPSNRF